MEWRVWREYGGTVHNFVKIIAKDVYIHKSMIYVGGQQVSKNMLRPMNLPKVNAGVTGNGMGIGGIDVVSQGITVSWNVQNPILHGSIFVSITHLPAKYEIGIMLPIGPTGITPGSPLFIGAGLRYTKDWIFAGIVLRGGYNINPIPIYLTGEY